MPRSPWKGKLVAIPWGRELYMRYLGSSVIQGGSPLGTDLAWEAVDYLSEEEPIIQLSVIRKVTD